MQNDGSDSIRPKWFDIVLIVLGVCASVAFGVIYVTIFVISMYCDAPGSWCEGLYERWDPMLFICKCALSISVLACCWRLRIRIWRLLPLPMWLALAFTIGFFGIIAFGLG